jgi:hypothetical protein
MSFIIVVGVLWCSCSEGTVQVVDTLRFRHESLDLSEEGFVGRELVACCRDDSVVVDGEWAGDEVIGGNDWDEVFIIYK